MKHRELTVEEAKVLDWLRDRRVVCDDWFSIVDICKATGRHHNQSSYRICFRLTAFNFLEHKTVKRHKNRNCWNNQIMVWRCKK